MVLATVSHPREASGAKQPDGVRPLRLPVTRLSRRSATLQKPLRADATVTQRRRLDPRRVAASRWRVRGESRPRRSWFQPIAASAPAEHFQFHACAPPGGRVESADTSPESPPRKAHPIEYRRRGLALTDGGLSAPEIAAALGVGDGALNGDLFLAYVRQRLAPPLRPGDILVLDNLQTHKVAGVEDRDARVLYLPPYSPGFNPIEQVIFEDQKRTAPTGAAGHQRLGSRLRRLPRLDHPDRRRQLLPPRRIPGRRKLKTL